MRSSSDHFSGPVRGRNLRAGDHFTSAAGSRLKGPLDDCFSSKVSSNKRSVFGSDPFSTRPGSRVKGGGMGDSFSMKVGGRASRKYSMGDGFSSPTAKHGMAMGDAFASHPNSRRRKNFKGEKRKWFFFKLDQMLPKDKKYKQKDAFRPSKKASAKLKEKRQSAPQMDLFRNAVWKSK